MDIDYFFKSFYKAVPQLEGEHIYQLYEYLDQVLDEKDAVKESLENPQVVDCQTLFEKAWAVREGRLSISGISTGYPLFDAVSGGFDQGEFVLIFGGAGRGKTMFAQNILHNFALEGIKSLVLSLEMGNTEMMKRLIDMHAFYSDPKEAASLPIYYFPESYAVTPETISNYLDYMVEQVGVRCVLVDHIGLLPDLKAEKRESYNAWTKLFAKLAKKLNITLILIQHTNKLTNDNEEPQLRDIAETSTSENNVDMAVVVWKDFKNPQNLLVKIKKNRLKGRLSGVPHILKIDFQTHKLTEELATSNQASFLQSINGGRPG